MRILLKELRTRHRAKVGAFLKRERAAIGYFILCIGVVVALGFTAHAQSRADHLNLVTRGVLCSNTIRQDLQALANLHTKSGQEIIKKLHLNSAEVKVAIAKQLRLSAEQRQALAPSTPPGLCVRTPTVLKNALLEPKGTP